MDENENPPVQNHQDEIFLDKDGKQRPSQMVGQLAGAKDIDRISVSPAGFGFK